MTGIKKFDTAFLKYILIASVIILIIAFYPIITYASPLQVKSILFGYLISLLNVMVGYSMASIGFEKKVRSFMLIVFGGMLVRMLFVAVLLLILLYVAHLEPFSLTASVFFFYFLFISIEIRFLFKKSPPDAQGN
jgi:hypothetical protein